MAAELLGKLIGLALAEGALPAGRLADLYGKCESAEYRRDFVAIALKYAKVRPRPCSRGPARGALLAGLQSVAWTVQWQGVPGLQSCLQALGSIGAAWARASRAGAGQARRCSPDPRDRALLPALRGARPRPPRCSVV